MFQIQTLLHNCNRDVGRNRDPYLRLHGIFRVAIKGFDSKVLFDPFEEQFDLPALFVKCANSVGWQGEIVCQKLEGIACFAVEERYKSKGLWIPRSGQHPSQSNMMIADQTSICCDGKRLHHRDLHVCLGTSDEERFGHVQCVKSREVDIRFVHHVKRASLDIALLAEDIEYFHIVHFSIADVNKTRNRSLQIYQSMKLDRCLGSSKRCPIEDAQTQVDRRRIQRVNGRAHQRRKLRTRRFVGVKRTRRSDQMMRQIRKDFPRPDSICVGQGIARNRFAAQPHVIKMFALRSQIDLDISQRFARSELRKGKNQELIQTTEILNFVLCSSSRNHSTECFERKISHDLREYQLSSVHDHPRQITSANDDSSWKSNSNRGHQKMGIYL